MKANIFRSLPEPHYDTFDIPFPLDGEFTLMDVLQYISENLDPTLTYFQHAVCHQGICGRCVVKYNGKNILACATHADCDEFTLDPRNSKIVRDLLCL